jgi:glycine/D-amino acid oxidase-like deaminating enzyme
MQDLDYIIVGQGLAGTTLAYRMLQAGLRIRVIDPCKPNSGSLVAAGIVNPVTGRKLVKSWRIDELLPEVRSLYTELEDYLSAKFLYPIKIYKLFQNAGEVNDWMARRQTEGYEHFLSDISPSGWQGVRASHGVGTIQGAYWLSVETLILAFRARLKSENLLAAQPFDHSRVRFSEGREWVNYDRLNARGIVFCEGYQGKSNPFFSALPLSFAKGEIMTIRCPELSGLDGILNRNGFVIPLGDDQFKVGATFRWKDESEEPSPEGLADLRKRLESILSLDYEILSVQAAFRPTCTDRRPLLGRSRVHASIWMFNGLGTKGVSLSAFFSKHLLAHMEHGQTLDSEVDLSRFESLR